ncbi:MAG: NmrA family NAD(P)-binding protein [Pseudomonadota bacterium]
MKSGQPTVLVVGATGYLGGHLIQAFHRAGYSVHALARTPDKLERLSSYIDVAHAVREEPYRPTPMKAATTRAAEIIS